jgi:hypothetical protein
MRDSERQEEEKRGEERRQRHFLGGCSFAL